MVIPAILVRRSEGHARSPTSEKCLGDIDLVTIQLFEPLHLSVLGGAVGSGVDKVLRGPGSSPDPGTEFVLTNRLHDEILPD